MDKLSTQVLVPESRDVLCGIRVIDEVLQLFLCKQVKNRLEPFRTDSKDSPLQLRSNTIELFMG